jgi:hypothetical protein
MSANIRLGLAASACWLGELIVRLYDTLGICQQSQRHNAFVQFLSIQAARTQIERHNCSNAFDSYTAIPHCGYAPYAPAAPAGGAYHVVNAQRRTSLLLAGRCGIIDLILIHDFQP